MLRACDGPQRGGWFRVYLGFEEEAVVVNGAVYKVIPAEDPMKWELRWVPELNVSPLFSRDNEISPRSSNRKDA